MYFNLKKSRVFYIALSAFLLMFIINHSNTIVKTVEVFKTNIEIGKVEKQGYRNYSALDGKLRFLMPSTWEVWEQSFSGGEILYHLNFLAPNKRIRGFIQIWKMEKPLEQFLEDSEKSPADSVEYKFYSRKEIIVNGIKGFLVQYEKANSKGNTYRTYESFLQGSDGHIYRASFYMQGKHWRNYHTISFNKIIQSFKIKQE